MLELLRSAPGAARGSRAAWPAYTPGSPQDDEAFARIFFRRFHVEAGPVLLVFDDAHAAPGEAFSTLLHGAIAEAPADTIVLLTSRKPPQGVLLDALARGNLQALDSSLLAFTLPETLALLGPRLGQAAATRLHQRTGGWAAGLVLLAAAPEAADGVAGTAAHEAAERAVSAFFAQRVLGLMDEPAQRLLAAASLVSDVDAPALQALGLGAAAADQMDGLSRQLGFVQRLNRSPRAWRLHDLLAEALRAALGTLGDATWRQQTLQRAAAVNAERGQLEAAVRLWLQAGDADAAQDALRRLGPACLRGTGAQQLESAAALLSPASVAADAPLQMLLGLAAALRQDPEAVAHHDRAWLALQAMPTDQQPAWQLQIAACALNALFGGWKSYVGREQWVQRFADSYAARSQVGDADNALRVDKAAVLTFLTHRMAPLAKTNGRVLPDADAQALPERLLQTLALPAHMLDPNAAVSAANTLIELCNYSGDHLFMARAVDHALPWLRHPGTSASVAASWWISFGWVSARLKLGRSDIPEGEAAVAQGAQLALDAGVRDIAFYGLINLVAAAASRNDLAAADARMVQLQAAAHERQPTQQATMHLLAARLLTQRGDATTALVRVDRALQIAAESDFPASETWVYHLGRVQVLTALAREADAQAWAAQSATAYDGMRRDHLHALAGLAAVAQALRTGQPVPTDVLTQMLSLAAGHRWTTLGNHLPGLMARVCALALSGGIETAFVTDIVRQRRLPAPDPDLPPWPWPLRVLALGGLRVLADGVALHFGARPQRKPLDLLKLLVARGPAPVDSTAFIDALWPDADGARAKASFDMALLRLRKLLGRDDAVRLEAGQLGLNRTLVWVDAWAWQAGALPDYAGPLFGADAADGAWAAAREHLHVLHLRRAAQRGLALEKVGDMAAALALFEATLHHDSLDETLHRGVLRCLLALGEGAAALRAWRRCQAALQQGLGVAPAASTRALVARLLDEA